MSIEAAFSRVKLDVGCAFVWYYAGAPAWVRTDWPKGSYRMSGDTLYRMSHR